MNGVQILFWIYALGACGGAVAVVLSQNVVRMAFWLIISLGSVAGLFFLLSADFVGATQIVIYVGGTAVLLIFGVMLTASGPYMKIPTSAGEGFLAAGVGLAFLGMLTFAVQGVDWDANQEKLAAAQGHAVPESGYNEEGVGNTVRPIGLAVLGLRPDRDLGAPRPEGFVNDSEVPEPDEKSGEPAPEKPPVAPEAIFRGAPGYLLPFEIASVHLLVVLIGAAYLARAKRAATKVPGND